jgi:hypothetical protein
MDSKWAAFRVTHGVIRLATRLTIVAPEGALRICTWSPRRFARQVNTIVRRRAQDYRVETVVVDEAIPVGFEKGGNPDELRISYRSRGTGCMIVFLVVVVGFVTAGFSFFALQDWQQFQAFIFAEW